MIYQGLRRRWDVSKEKIATQRQGRMRRVLFLPIFWRFTFLVSSWSMWSEGAEEPHFLLRTITTTRAELRSAELRSTELLICYPQSWHQNPFYELNECLLWDTGAEYDNLWKCQQTCANKHTQTFVSRVRVNIKIFSYIRLLFRLRCVLYWSNHIG